jgi:hypothetical protein
MPNESSDKFSKPQWRKNKRDGAAIEIHSGFRLVATVPHPDRHEPNEENDANADLIAASQNLLEALSIAKCRLEQATIKLQYSKDSVSQSLAGFIRADLVRVRSAINQATGGRAESRRSEFAEEMPMELPAEAHDNEPEALLHAKLLATNRERELNRVKWLLTQIVQDLPINRDWLNPDIEKEARFYTQNIGIGTRVVMPEPNATDSYSIGGFVGTVADILGNGNLIVEDADAVFHEIEAARIVELAASEEAEQSTGVKL